MGTEDKLVFEVGIAGDALVRALDPACRWSEVDALINETEIGDINQQALAQAVRSLSKKRLIEVGRPARLQGRKAVRLTSDGAIRAHYLANHARSQARASLATKATKTLVPFVLGSALTGCSTFKMSMPFQKPEVAGSYSASGQTPNTPHNLMPRGMSVAPEGTPLQIDARPLMTEKPPEIRIDTVQQATPSVATPATATATAKIAPDLRRQAVFFPSNSVKIGNQMRVIKGFDANGKKPLQVRLLASTDSTGSLEVNRRLAKARALTVVYELVKMGIDRKNIQIKLAPMGSEDLRELSDGQFVPSSSDAIARRVELEFISRT
jgi:outer membrane protein OmpA-like peptidoglycan-associated protein